MKVIQNINNNVAICIDGNGNEVVAFGKGIGFHTPPYELHDLSQIKRTFYDVNPELFGLINLIDADILDIAAMTIDYAKRLNTIFDPNVVFTLADHIQFAIKRTKEHLQMKLSFYYDLEYMNAEEVEISTYAYTCIQERLKVTLPKEEIYGIALHLINAQAQTKMVKQPSHKESINQMIKLIEERFQIKIDRKGFNYARFVSHMEYVYKRYQDGSILSSENASMFAVLKQEYPQAYDCALSVSEIFQQAHDMSLSEEELLYLMIHINRLCSREDCYQTGFTPETK